MEMRIFGHLDNYILTSPTTLENGHRVGVCLTSRHLSCPLTELSARRLYDPSCGLYTATLPEPIPYVGIGWKVYAHSDAQRHGSLALRFKAYPVFGHPLQQPHKVDMPRSTGLLCSSCNFVQA